MKKQMFTLIELLIVIAIIGILLSLLLPSLKKAKDAAVIAVCASNQKQLGIAFSSYSSSNNGYLPAPPAFQYTWDDLLSGYDGRAIPKDWDFTGLNSTGSWSGTFLYEDWGNQHDLYHCPVDPTNDSIRTTRSYAVNDGFPSFPDSWQRYGGPILSGYRVNQGFAPWSMNFSSINKSSSSILMGERVVTTALKNANMGHNNGASSASFKSDLINNNRSKHGRELKLNYLFIDMHVSFLNYHALNADSGKYLWGSDSDVRGTLLDCKK